MTNPYFSSYTPLPRNQIARAEAVNAIIDLIIQGFDNLPDTTALQQGRLSFCEDGGVANAYALTATFPIDNYQLGQSFTFLAGNTNTGASTVNVNALGVKQIVRADGSPLVAGDIRVDRIISVQYDGTAFQLMSATANDATVVSAAAAAQAAAEDAADQAAAAVAAAAAFDGSLYLTKAGNGAGIADPAEFRGSIGLRIGTAKMWVNVGDPGADAQDGDIWIP